jgi:S1-C subfamily serine protease
MKLIAFTVIFIFLFKNSFSQDILFSSQLEITLHINNKAGSSGTGFILDRDSSTYIITARHLFSQKKNGDTILFDVKRNSRWMTIKGIIFLDSNKNVDVAVIWPFNSGKKFKGNSYSYSDEYDVLSDVVFFIGYPLGFELTDSLANDGFPLPLVKKGIFSGVIVTPDKVTVSFFDAHNNPGFSGGPIFMVNRIDAKKKKIKLVGVVSGYVNQDDELVTPAGRIKYASNSGIMIGIGINHVDKILRDIAIKRAN